MKRILGVSAVTLGLILAGCGGDETGPGELIAEIDAPVAMSAAVLEFTGTGITSVGPAGAGTVEARATGTGYRAVVFREGAGPIRVSLQVEDVGRVPEGIVVEAANADGRPVDGVGGMTVRVSR